MTGLKFVPPAVIIFASILIALTSNALSGDLSTDKDILEQHLNQLPDNLEPVEDRPQKYALTTVWNNRNISGAQTAKYIIHGIYTRGLPDDSVRWNDVMIEIFNDSESSRADTSYQQWMEDFSYKSPDDLASPELFIDFPTDESRHLLYTLIWDAVLFEVYGWNYLDQLELNRPMRPADLENFAIDMAGWGTLKMRNLKLTRVGISEMNGEICALLNYESFSNPVESFGTKGRSLYWGSIWISMEDKQIEYGRLNEDVIVKLAGPKKDGKFINIQREIEFRKLID